jgi:protein-disulfide isomerase
MLRTGRWSQLDRLRGTLDPERLFRTIPGVGGVLARRIHEGLDVDSLETLEVAAHDGRLAALPGLGPRRAAMIRAALSSMLGRARWQPAKHRHERRGEEPSVATLLDVDREYRREADRLPKIAPRRFNPQRRAWLPILHTERDRWHFTALFSNTALAHRLGRTRDWVVLYFQADHGPGFYNFYRYGNCSGPTGTGFCVFDPSGARRRYSGVVTGHTGETVKPGDGGNPALGPAGARVTLIEFGSYTCPYTRASEPGVREIVRQHTGAVRLVFRHLPLDGLDTLRGGAAIGCEESSGETRRRPAAPEDAGVSEAHAGATRAAIAADCAGAQGRFWDYHERLAANPGAMVTCAGLIELARGLGVDQGAFARCLEDPAMREHVRRDFEDGVKAHQVLA